MWKKIVFIVANVFYPLIVWYLIKYCVDWFVDYFSYSIWTIICGIAYFIIIATIAVGGMLGGILLPTTIVGKDFVIHRKNLIIYWENLWQIAMAIIIMYDKLSNQTAVVYTVLMSFVLCVCYSLLIVSIAEENIR